MREGADRDLRRVAEIKVRSWADTYAPLIPDDALRPFLDLNRQLEYLREAAARPDAILLVAGEGARDIVGFALTFVDERPDPWLESIHVRPDAQGRGAGTLLMRANARAIRERGFATMRLGVVAGNTAAERFYERLGGIPGASEPASWAEGVTHHIFRWPALDMLL